MDDAPTSARFLSIAAAAGYCSLSPKSIRRLIGAGKLTALRPCRGRVVLDRVELDAFILASATPRLRVGRGLGRRVSA